MVINHYIPVAIVTVVALSGPKPTDEPARLGKAIKPQLAPFCELFLLHKKIA